MSIKIKELPELERPYEKLEMYGEKALSNAELLAIIIKTGTKEETAVGIAQNLLKLNDTTRKRLNIFAKLKYRRANANKGNWKSKSYPIKSSRGNSD